MTGFTAEQAFEAREDGDPELITLHCAKAIIRNHDCSVFHFLQERNLPDVETIMVDAADVLAWLGY